MRLYVLGSTIRTYDCMRSSVYYTVGKYMMHPTRLDLHTRAATGTEGTMILIG